MLNVFQKPYLYSISHVHLQSVLLSLLLMLSKVFDTFMMFFKSYFWIFTFMINWSFPGLLSANFEIL